MNTAARILLGALSGWLTGKALDGEHIARGKRSANGRLGDVICGIVGALFGEHLFFWIVIGHTSFGNHATAVLGAIAVVGAGRLIAARLNRSRQTTY